MTWTTRPRSNTGSLAAIVQGQGPLIVLLHGVGLRAEAWGAQIDHLADKGYRVVAPDMIGHGESPFKPAHTIQDFSTPVTEVLDEPALIIGHSMGSMMALHVALSHPGQMRGLVALNAVYQRDEAAQKAVQLRASSLDGQSVSDPEQTLARWFGSSRNPQRDACETWLRSVSPRAYKAAYCAFARSTTPTSEQLERLSCPALFMTGSEEPNSTPEMSHRMADTAANARAHDITGAAHMMPMTHPDETNAKLESFAQHCFGSKISTPAPGLG
ncbi:MAG: alpha/beta hydrolase [Pseudomonadota bacterium]